MNHITDEQLSAFLDDALAPGERASIVRALAGSPKLQKELADLKQLKSLLRSGPLPEPPEQFFTNVLKKVKHRPRPWGTWTFSFLGAAAAALLMVYVVHDSKPTLSLEKEEKQVPATAMLQSTMDFQEMAQRESLVPNQILSKDVHSPKEKLLERKTAWDKSTFRGQDASLLPLQEAEDLVLEKDMARKGLNTRETLQTPQPASMAPAPSSKKDVDLGIARGKPSDLSLKNKQALSLKDGSPLETSAQEWAGEYSGITIPREVVVRDAKSWAKLWAEHQSPMGTPAPTPEINFNNYRVVGIFLGDRGSSGYSVRILGMHKENNEWIITYQETKPNTSGGIGFLTVMTQPYHIKVIPQSNTPVRFIEK